MVPVLNWLLNHWFLIFILGALGVFEGIRDFFIGIAEAVAGVFAVHHERRIELAEAQGRAAVEPRAPLPGRCVHRRVKQVRDMNDELVGWLCVGCDAQLPADWAIAAEDLPGGER